MNVLVLGASGMLGSATFQVLSEKTDWQVYGTIRSASSKRFFQKSVADRLIVGVDADQQDSIVETLNSIRPQVVINCIGLVKQLAESGNPLQAIPINTLLPHRLARICELGNARIIHISTDCVFSGNKGAYLESDFPDANDLYGRSKYLGELDYPNAITLRTSIIGHELQSAHSLVDWFMAQNSQCKGYTRAIFSGVPTVVLAKIIRDIVIPHTELHGVYHVASRPISKFHLLGLIAKIYSKNIDIIPDDELIIDRSLDAKRFHLATGGFTTPEWDEMIKQMYAHKLNQQHPAIHT